MKPRAKVTKEIHKNVFMARKAEANISGRSIMICRKQQGNLWLHNSLTSHSPRDEGTLPARAAETQAPVPWTATTEERKDPSRVRHCCGITNKVGRTLAQKAQAGGAIHQDPNNRTWETTLAARAGTTSTRFLKHKAAASRTSEEGWMDASNRMGSMVSNTCVPCVHRER